MPQAQAFIQEKNSACLDLVFARSQGSKIVFVLSL